MKKHWGKLVILAIILTISSYFVMGILLPKPQETSIITSTPIPTTEPTPTPSQEDIQYEQEYDSNKTINPEYIGRITFSSKIVDQNVVQTTDNEKYLHYAWDLQKSTQGAAFMDYQNVPTDQNLILYGHYVYYDENAMFTQLEKLLTFENYESNKEITFRLEHEKREYIITDVFYYNLDQDKPQYYYPNYTEEEFHTFYHDVKEADLYDTGNSITYEDRWLTIQTCVRNHDELREIIIAKEVSVS